MALSLTLGAAGAQASLVSQVNCAIDDVDTFTLDTINLSAAGFTDGAQVWQAPEHGISGVYTACRGFFDGNKDATHAGDHGQPNP